MKSTNTLPCLHGLKFLSPPITLLLLLFWSLSFTGSIYAQQSDLTCNTITPWTANLFDLDVDFSSSLLACWDGDIACIIPGSHEPALVIDNNLGNFATGDIVLGGFLTLSVTDPVNTYNAGNFVGFVISSGLLDVDVFSSITIRTYLNNSPKDVFTGYDLIGLNTALFDSPYTVGFITTEDYDEVEITFAAGIVAGQYNVHYAVMEAFCEGPELVCNEHTQMNSPAFPMTVDYELTGSTGISISAINNPENAISASTTDFASLTNLVDVLDSLSIAVEDQVTDYPAGTFVGFDIQNLTVLGLGLLDNIVITSYLNGVKQQTKAGSDLLLGLPLLDNSGRQTVGFVTNTAVDKVRFTLANPLNINLGTTLVYSAIFTGFCEGPALACNQLTSIYSPEFPVYINAFRSGFDGAVCLDCSIENPDRLIDNDPSSYAEIDITAGVATVGSISVKGEITDYPANTFAGFHIENVQLVDVDVLTGVTITTYLNGFFAEQVSGTDILLTAGTDLLVNPGEYYAGFVTTEPFDEVRISLTNVGMVNIGTTRIYETVIGAFCPADIVCDTNYFLTNPEFPVYIDFELTGLSGIACALCEVEDADEVITASNTDFASITITAGVGETGSIAVRDALYVYPPGTIAGFVIEDLNGLLQADLFGSITISTFLGGDLQEFAFGANLIDAELLILFINPDAGVYNVGFQTTMPFDEVRITVGSLVSVINLIDVYGAFVDTRYSVGGAGGLNCPDPPIAEDDSGSTPEETPVTMNVLNNDDNTDSPMGLPEIVDSPAHGMVVVNPIDSTTTYTPDENFVGLDSFTYAICDGGLPPLCDTAIVIVFVYPMIDTIQEMIPEDSTFMVCADDLTTFTTPSNSISLCNDPADGSVDINGACATYMPNAGFNGNDTFCLVVCDPLDPLLCDTTIVIITVGPVNDPPIAVDDTEITPEDTPVVINVLSNDSDPDSPLGIPTISDPPTNGMVVVNPMNGLVTYTPDENFVGQDSFMYSICDDGMPVLCDTALVVVHVSPVIDTIIVNIPEDEMFDVCADELTTFTVPATSLSNCEEPENGEVTIVGTCATYIPDLGYNGQDTFCVVTCDPNDPLLCDTTIIIVVIGPMNSPPVAVDDNATTPEDTPVVIEVLDNDSDPDSPLGVPTITETPNNGTVVVNPSDGTIMYTPEENFVGIDSFEYSICDSGFPVYCDTAVVVVSVSPVIDTIIVHIPEDSMFTICADELTTFTEPSTSLTDCGQPSMGSTDINFLCATYTPEVGYNGQDTFCLVTCDPNDPLLCDTTIVIVIIDPLNNPPAAVDDSATTPEDTPVVINVLSNDSDPDSPLGIPTISDPPANGMAVVNPMNGLVTYTPDENFVGEDSFMYSICDDGIPPLCDTALVTVTVSPVMDTIHETIPENTTVMECADELTTFTTSATSISLCGGPADGSVSIVSTCATYTPDLGFNGNDTFCLVVCDPLDPQLCDTTIVIITVTPLNNPPVAVDDSATTPEDTPVVINVLSNDSDPDSPLGIPTISDPPSNGMTSVNPMNGLVTYTPDENFVGEDSFMYTICDNGMPPLCDMALVIVTVSPVTDTIYETIPEDGNVIECADDLTTFTTSATSISLCGGPADGSVSIVSTCATYTPDLGFNGNDTFCLVVCDPLDPQLCDTTIVIITVTPLNNPPVAVDDSATTPEDTPVVINVLSNDSDPDSPLGIPTISDPPANGMAVVNPMNGLVTYTPDENFVGEDSFMYTICDNGMPPLCDMALVIVTVSPVTDTIYETIPEDGNVIECADDLTTFTTSATSISLCGGPADGSVSIVSTCATYTPDLGFNGNDTFCLLVCDPLDPQLCDTTIVIITVTPLNNPPVAVDDSATTPEDTPVVINVLSNDSDPDSPLGIPTISDPPANGMAVVNPMNGLVTYTPDENFVGEDSFMYSICDDGMPALCDIALVIVTVSPVIDTIYETIPENTTVMECADELTTFTTSATNVGLCAGPSAGSLSITGTCASYTPDQDFSGNDTFCLVICDPLNPQLCDTTIVIITVLAPICLEVKTWVYLEGSCVGTGGDANYTLPMRKSLNAVRVLPGQCLLDPFFGLKCTPPGQPYNVAPWNYTGTEGDQHTPADDIMEGDAGYASTVVDWVLVSLRDSADGSGGPICQAAALVHQDGHVEFTEPFDCCEVDSDIPYYIVIEHRNHLIVMSDEPVMAVNDTLSYDFRNHQSYLNDPLDIGIYAQQKQIMQGVFAMYAGNGNQFTAQNSDTDINFDDRSYWETLAGPTGTYSNADYNLNADTNFNDRVVWERNNGRFTSVARN